MTTAPKPANFEQLARTWADPVAFAAELARYYAQLQAEAEPIVDITEPRRTGRDT